MFDFVMFLDAYQNPILLSLALSLSELYIYIYSFFKYLEASFESSA